MPSKRFTCVDCGHAHALNENQHLLRTVAREGRLYCEKCGHVWYVAVQPSGVVPRAGDEVHAWLNNWAWLNRDSSQRRALLHELIKDYVAHANQRISLEEPVGEVRK